MAAIRVRREIAVRGGSLNVREYGGNARLCLTILKRHPGFEIDLLNQFDTRCVTNYGIKPQAGAVLADVGGNMNPAIFAPFRWRPLRGHPCSGWRLSAKQITLHSQYRESGIQLFFHGVSGGQADAHKLNHDFPIEQAHEEHREAAEPAYQPARSVPAGIRNLAGSEVRATTTNIDARCRRFAADSSAP
jgi:hypothetical protein